MKKYLFIFGLAFIILPGIAVFQYFVFYDGRLNVVFCDVGQGDAVFIRTPDGKNILFDGGPDRSVLSCLSQVMPFWDRKLDLVVLSHPHLDHFMGIYYVLESYSITSFVKERLVNKIAVYDNLVDKITERKISQRIVYKGDRYKIGRDVVMSVESPSKEFLEMTSTGGEIGESGEFASIILRLTYKDFDLLLTGDAQLAGMREAVGRADAFNGVQVFDSEVIQTRGDRGVGIDVLQVPHHGSGTGLDARIVDILGPKLAVVSVGAKNRYGHPNGRILDLLENAGVRVLRTDKIGNVEIVSDGVRFWVK
jgi:competence protein ComEC